MLEAFQFAKAEVAKAYEREGLLATEHALLDDNGDKEGSQDPSATGKDGKVANIVSLGTVGKRRPAHRPQAARAVSRAARARAPRRGAPAAQGNMEPARYTAELEKLVTALALKTREIRTAEGK